MSEDTDDISEDDISWQVVAQPTLKHRQNKSPTIFEHKRIHIDKNNSTAINNNKNKSNINNNVANTSKHATSPNGNRFAALANDNDEIDFSDVEDEILILNRMIIIIIMHQNLL